MKSKYCAMNGRQDGAAALCYKEVVYLLIPGCICLQDEVCANSKQNNFSFLFFLLIFSRFLVLWSEMIVQPDYDIRFQNFLDRYRMWKLNFNLPEYFERRQGKIEAVNRLIAEGQSIRQHLMSINFGTSMEFVTNQLLWREFIDRRLERLQRNLRDLELDPEEHDSDN